MAEAVGRPEPLGKLTADTVKVEDLPRFPEMTGWFEPVLLSKLLGRVIVSDLFGQYADRRLIEAALDTASKEELVQRADLTKEVRPDDDGAIWVDYVSDLGDGFDATYAIAYLLAQSQLEVSGTDAALPRGSVLVMGGDEVYPTAQRDEYLIKMRKPYEFARPYSDHGEKSPVLLIPGNHDWYDGLVNFLAIFCRQKQTRIGSWYTTQRRSYFAAKLSENWWIWGIDIALVRDMDQPQADYFVTILEDMPENANLILCSAEPGWYKAEAKENSYRTLSYVTQIVKQAKGKRIRIPLVLSGDTHHYARYSDGGTQYITSGGGGAFLHGTLELKPKIVAEWLVEPKATLSLTTTPDEHHSECEIEACYPTKSESRKLLSGNINFFKLNKGFSFLLGHLYWFCALIVVAFVDSIWRIDVIFLMTAFLGLGFWFYTFYQEGPVKHAFWLSMGHAAAHMIFILTMSGLLAWLLYSSVWPWWTWAAIVWVYVVPLGSVVAGTLFGLHLWLTCAKFNYNHNDAFSSMQLNSHRHFLRMKIHGDAVTVYPVAINNVPERHEWSANPARVRGGAEPVFLPNSEMRPFIIEGPVVITALRAASTADVKPASELPPKIKE